MMKTCVVCGRIHDINKICKRVTKQKATPGTKFRKSYVWTEKSKGIRARDKDLCQVCITGKYNTNYRYTYKELEVHHIVPIARSLSYNPKMIVADEPTGNLDKQTETEILDIFKKLAHNDGKCVIIVTHSPNVCKIVDEVYHLKKVK